MPQTSRSGCPINLTLEQIGDRWSLIVIRDVTFENRRSYGALLEQNEEGIAGDETVRGGMRPIGPGENSDPFRIADEPVRRKGEATGIHWNDNPVAVKTSIAIQIQIKAEIESWRAARGIRVHKDRRPRIDQEVGHHFRQIRSLNRYSIPIDVAHVVRIRWLGVLRILA